ncbi:MAG: DUF2130 domain-containing protein [Hyphomicrobium sp.]
MSFSPSTAAKPHVHLAGERCPTCDQEIPNDRLDEVKNKIAARDRQLQADAEARVKSEVERARFEGAAALEAAKAEIATREQAARVAGEQRAAEGFEAKLKEAADAKAASDKQIADLKAAQEAAIAARVAEAREALEKSKIDAVNAEQAKTAAERIKLESMVADLQRKLQNKSVEDLGEGAEVDLFETLKAAFPTDLITRVGRGNPGADVIHEVRHNGATCGRIVYDSKNHLQWRSDHATKLRDDRIAAGADHAILSTRAFPKDKRQLAIEHGVIIANPARAVIIATMLRQQIVELHRLKVSNDQRATKTEELYAMMTSDRFGQFLGTVEKAAKQLEALQEAERKAHETTWKKQGELHRIVIRTCAQFDQDIARIIGTAGSADVT